MTIPRRSSCLAAALCLLVLLCPASALAAPPEKVAADYWRGGLTAMEKKDYQRAIELFTEAIRLIPKFTDAYISRGDAYRTTRAYDRAIADYTQALRLSPRNTDALVGRGMSHRKKRQLDKAIADYTEAIKIDPKGVNARYNRANAYKAQRDFARALADFQETLRLDPRYAEAHNNLAWLSATCPDAKFRDGKRAVEHATRACELTEWKRVDMVDTLAVAQAEAGNFEQAVQWARKAVELAPEDVKDEVRSHLRLFEANKPYREK
jgi:tetratricopeptide (TPR) repeat protein